MKQRIVRALALSSVVLVAALSPRLVLAWDSTCTTYGNPHVPVARLEGGVKCAEGADFDPGSSRFRPTPGEPGQSEHLRILEDAARRVGIPERALETYTLSQWINTRTASGTGHPPRIDYFFDADEERRRSFSVSEMAMLPDFSYSLWDWARGNDTCPLVVSRGEVLDPERQCHAFTHMGGVNSSHFPPQADQFYRYYHQLAQARAGQCVADRARALAVDSDADARFREFFLECEVEALTLEAIAQHYLQDTWSAGHMWQRWGGTDLADYVGIPFSDETLDLFCEPPLTRAECSQQTQALVVGVVAGLFHGTEPLTRVCDLLCCPDGELGSAYYWHQGASGGAALGDVHLTAIAGQQATRLSDCAAASIASVYDLLAPSGMTPMLGARTGTAPSVDPLGPACSGARTTNESMALTASMGDIDVAGIIAAHPGYSGFSVAVLAAIVGLAEIQPALVVTILSAAGLWYAETLGEGVGLTVQLRMDLMSITEELGEAAIEERIRPIGDGPIPDVVSADTIGPLLGVTLNGEYLPGHPSGRHGTRTLASYIDPPLPWPDPDGTASPLPPRASENALALARTFHRAHAAELCASTTTVELELLREHVGMATSPIACGLCVEIAQRHIRLGTDASGYDMAAEPLCHLLARPEEPPLYLYAEGGSQRAAAFTWCGCDDRVAVLTDTGTHLAAGVPLALETASPLDTGTLPRDGIAIGDRLYVGSASGEIAGVALADASLLDLNGPASGMRVALGGEARGLATVHLYGHDWLLVANGATDRLHVLLIPDSGAMDQTLIPCPSTADPSSPVLVDLGRDPSRTEGPWDILVSRDSTRAYVSLRGPLSRPSDAIAVVDLRLLLGDYALTGTCVDDPFVTHLTRGASPRGFGAMAMSPDGSRMAVATRLGGSGCPDQIFAARVTCGPSTCTSTYAPADTNVGCDRVEVFQFSDSSWTTYDTRPMFFPYAVEWLDDSHLAVATFQFPVDPWPQGPAGVVSPISTGGAVRLIDVDGGVFDDSLPGTPTHPWSYHVSLGSAVVGQALHHARSDNTLYVGTLSGALFRLPLPTAETYGPALDPFWESSPADPDVNLHGLAGTWFGGCRESCMSGRALPYCPRACTGADAGVDEIDLGSAIRAIVRLSGP